MGAARATTEWFDSKRIGLLEWPRHEMIFYFYLKTCAEILHFVIESDLAGVRLENFQSNYLEKIP